MSKIKLYNNIAQIGLDQFTPDYEVNENMEDEDAILVRSANLHDIEYNTNLKAIFHLVKTIFIDKVFSSII
jgi:D-3-phosphoglycerate dehydrogenase / 2-oxoglutarate reductase